MRRNLTIGNRQRDFRVDVRRLREVTQALLEELFEKGGFEIGVFLVNEAEMTRLNETFLKHRGSTDVITFDYGQNSAAESWRRIGPKGHRQLQMHGELFVCLEVASAQARRFGTTWQSELARYITHGLLHLRGFDDVRPASRHRMKREEARLLKRLSRRFELERLRAEPDGAEQS